MVQLANNTFDCLAQCVTAEIPDLRLLAFKLVTGKLLESPFSEGALTKVRAKLRDS